MQSVAYFSVLLTLASLVLAASQPAAEQVVGPANQNGSPVQVESVQVVPQQAPPQQQQQQQQSVVVSNQPPQVQVHHASQPMIGQEQGGIVVPVEHHQHEQHQHQHQQVPQHFQGAASYYSQAPAGLIQVVGAEQQQGVVNKPGQLQQAGVVRSAEQYGQPESAALPPNYKPFGSWGLYIGGNPADGYYTNYYKQLGSSVEKAQSGGVEQQGIVKPTSALSPMLKQASGLSPFSGGDYYPFAYSMNDLSTVSRGAYSPPAVGAVEQPSASGPVVHHGVISPVQAGAQVYGSPASFVESNSQHYGVSPYYAPVESYATTKKLGSTYQQPQVQVKETSKAAELPFVQQQQQYQQQPPKGYLAQSRVYVYPPQQLGPLSAPVAFSPSAVVQQPHHQQQQQVVAYPVPVASQIVGSQAGVDGAFAPYGVHAFTRYAVKPTMVSGAQANAENSYHQGVSSQMPAYKQQHSQTYYSQVAPNTHYYPMSYYGYPLNQLHYSQGSIVPAVHGAGESIYHSPSSAVVVGGSQVEASEKSEASSNSEEKQQVNNNKQQQQQQQQQQRA